MTPGNDKKLTKRPGEKRLTLALDGETYKRLRLYAGETDQTHQAILEAALAEYLEEAGETGQGVFETTDQRAEVLRLTDDVFEEDGFGSGSGSGFGFGSGSGEG